MKIIWHRAGRIVVWSFGHKDDVLDLSGKSQHWAYKKYPYSVLDLRQK